MSNLLNIDDKVKINIPGSVADGKEVIVESMQKMSGEIFYMGKYNQECYLGSGGFETAIQFKEGQYEVISSSNKNRGLVVTVNINADDFKKALDQLINKNTQRAI